MSALVSYNVMRWSYFLLLILLLLPLLGTTPLWATGVSIEAVPDYEVDLPTVVTNNETGVSYTWGYVCANITDTGGENATTTGGVNAVEIGFDWDWDASGEPYAYNWGESGDYSIGEFSYNLTSLPSSTIIYYRAKARNGGGWGYGGEGNFTTLIALPLVPTNFTATQTGNNTVTLNWTKGTYAVTTIIRCSDESQPSTLSDGYEVYNGTGESCNLTGLSLEKLEYYYSAWGYNNAGYSDEYAETNIGGALMSMSILLIGIMGLGAILTHFQFKNRSLPLSLASAAVWLAVFLWLFLGEVPGFDTTTLWGQVIPFVFILLTFVPILTFIGRMGKKEITASSKQGSYTEWSKPENIKLSRSQSVKDAHRARIRGVIDKHRVR